MSFYLHCFPESPPPHQFDALLLKPAPHSPLLAGPPSPATTSLQNQTPRRCNRSEQAVRTLPKGCCRVCQGCQRVHILRHGVRSNIYWVRHGHWTICVKQSLTSSSSHRAVDWNFPSPSQTPTSTSFPQSNFFQTPKASGTSSHFQDAFTTPQVPTYTTPRQPDYATMTPIQGQQMSLENIRNNYYANMQPGAVGGQVMPPVQVGYPQTAALSSPAFAYGQAPHMLPATAMSFDSSQMATPPPTRGSSVKKQSREVAFGTPSTIASRRFMTPQQVYNSSQNVPATQHASMQYPQLQFSPDVYQFGNPGPASAPVFPQTQLLWGSTASPTMYHHQPSLDDPFQVSAPTKWTAAPSSHREAQNNAFDTTPAMGTFPVQAPIQRPVSAGHYSTAQGQTQVPVMTTASVDPSLVYSSPIRPVTQSASRAIRPRGSASKAEVKRKDSGMAERKRSETLSSTDTVSSHGGLRRSSTIGTTRTKGTPVSDSLSRSNSMLSVPRTASPLKRVGKPLLGSISETKQLRPRASVVLTIDESGRASTVTQRPDNSPTKSVRERYPGLFDSDSSDAESDDDEDTESRSASFSFSRGEERRSKTARLDPPIENLDGLKLQRSSSSASMRVSFTACTTRS